MTQMWKTLTLVAAIGAGLMLQARDVGAQDPQSIVVAGGCFWCVESDFESVQGVIEAQSGYTGGTTANPTYRAVASGGTGHFEAVKITYDADQLSLAQLYHLFFRSIDPTDDGGQFCDRGTPYLSAIFAATPEQRRAAQTARSQAEAELGQPIVTPILDLGAFYPAEEYHQDYYKKDERLGITSVGVLVTKATAYGRYRRGCGRDARVRALWGDAAPFAQNH